MGIRELGSGSPDREPFRGPGGGSLETKKDFYGMPSREEKPNKYIESLPKDISSWQQKAEQVANSDDIDDIRGESGKGKNGTFATGKKHTEVSAQVTPPEGDRGWKKVRDRVTHVFSRTPQEVAVPKPSEGVEMQGIAARHGYVADQVRSIIDNLHVFTPSEIPATEQQKDQERAIDDAIISYGRDELECDFSSRMKADVHYFGTRDDFKKALEANNQIYTESNIGLRLGTDILIYGGLDSANEASNVQHEKVHLIPPEKAFIVRNEDGDGYSPRLYHKGLSVPTTRAFLGVTETLVEMTNIDIQNTQWKGRDPLAGLSEKALPTYSPLMIVTDDIIRRVASAEDASYKEVFRTLQRGELQGDRSVLRSVANVVGTNGMRALARGTKGDIPIQELAEEIGLSYAKERLDAFDADEEVLLFGDRSSMGYEKNVKRAEITAFLDELKQKE